VNVHAFADLLEAHLKRRTDIEIVISDERAQLMETGGGVAQARPLLGDDPIIVCNIDSVWEEWNGSAIARLAYSFNPEKSGAKLMLADMTQCLGFEGAGDFFVDDGGALAFRGDAPSAPWAYMGAQIIDPRIVDEEPLEPFGFMRIWRKLQSEGRLHGAPLGGYWMHVGDPEARAQAEARLAAAAPIA
jgi:MurNAc alpha-1-phosphate uridylyltransferase